VIVKNSRAQKAAAQNTASLLVEALPYIQRFRGKIVVVKYGGNALAGTPGDEDAGLASFATDIVLMRSVGMRPLVVHGGGPQIGALMARLGKVPEFIDGLRVTDAETLDIARMVLVGKVNRDIVSAINVHAPLAVGVSGEDAGLISAQARDPLLGFVGDVTAINPDLVTRLLAEDLIPVVATIGNDPTGQAYNINADTAAGAIAEAVRAAKLVYLTDVDGIRRDRGDPASRISTATTGDLEGMLADGTIDGGMIPKVLSCLRAVNGGVGQAHILDGRQPHALLLEVFTHEGVGTMVIDQAAPVAS
jgi:acetylglutamate kinase